MEEPHEDPGHQLRKTTNRYVNVFDEDIYLIKSNAFLRIQILLSRVQN